MKYLQKIWEQLKKLELHVWVAAVILVLVINLLLIDLGKSYVAETTVIVLPKSELAAVQLEKITNNIAAFPEMLAFRERLLLENSGLKDETKNQQQFLRQLAWQRQISTQVTKFSRSSLIKISVQGKNQSEARLLATKSTQTLFGVTSKFYNLEKDLDLKVANGPIVKAQVPWAGALLLLSIFLGFALAVLIEVALIYLEKNLLRKRMTQNAAKVLHERYKNLRASFFKSALPEIKKVEDIYLSHEEEKLKVEKAPKKEPVFEELEKIHQKKQVEIYPNFPEMPVREAAKAAAPENLPVFDSAPSNLPVADEAYEVPKFTPIEAEEKVEEIAPAAPVVKEEEPTQTELKKRLNQLLKGDL